MTIEDLIESTEVVSHCCEFAWKSHQWILMCGAN
jgi:hypothetical protein